MTVTKKNVIAEIRNGTNLDEHLSVAKESLFKEGSVDTTVLEILSYLKIFQPTYFATHENDVIEMMGLYFKHPTPSSFVSLIFANYGEYIKETYGTNFTPVQADILKKIRTMHTFSFSAPTSTGKSFVFRELIKNADYDVVVVVPSRALINEYYDRVHEIIDSKNVNILTFVEIINTKHAKRNIFILTPERARELFKQKDRLNIGFVLFDEAQLSDEDSVRGLYFDSIVRRVQRSFPSAKCVFAHPFIANPEAQLKKNHVDIDENADALYYEQKNVGQIFYTHDKSRGEFYHFGIDKALIGEQKIKANFDPVAKAIKEGGSVLIFVSKAHIYNDQIFEDFKNYIDLCSEITNPAALEFIAQLQDYVGATNGKNTNYVSKILERLKRGIVIHHGSIPLRARLILEHFTQQGFCRICFATSTLEQGINMPFDVVYLDRFLASSPLSIKNLIGRAGRSTSHSIFDVGAVVIKQPNMSKFRILIKTPEKIDEQSHLDKEDEKLDEKYEEYKEAIKTDQFNDEYNLTNADVQKLASDEISYTVATLLDLMFDNNGFPIYPKWEQEENNARKAIYGDFHSLYRQYLGGRELTIAEKNILNQAIKIMMWRVFKKTFKLICQYRYDYASRKKERTSSENAEEISKLKANFLRGYADIPDKSLQNFSLLGNTPAELVDYDLIIYDTYDYLDKLIGFKLSDIYYAIFHQYYQSSQDERALRLAKYIRFGTDTESEIWMLKYGLTFEDIEWASSCIDSIDEKEIVFNDKYYELTEEQRALLERFHHQNNSV
ncbi:DEAD/DEAH box helicase [Sporomusa sphaeroides]|uniref:Ski2-like helicase n=1 Tax=Sporomusa sphaeroides DSM 2875 TaxID=1337886 RepID=A0ABP2C6U9_9FIRM|nr:DEAD/DEAH box helicase [Sporomusa sphaeroides]OLS54745.1 ski2-like helicase [Sporomusa sphaeroides DSM 2875]CVK20106.1 ski2-like helicase [Sporomusa sphaeroides DSM 2875]